MKTLITTLAITLMLSATSAFAQGVRNGDPGLALTDVQTLPEAGVLTRLMAAFERGSVPSLENFLNGRKSTNGIFYMRGQTYSSIQGANSDVPTSRAGLICRLISNGPLLAPQIFCDTDSAHVIPEALVKFTSSGVYIGSTDKYYRFYNGVLIGVRFAKDGKCVYLPFIPNENNVCQIDYLFQ